MSSDQIRKYKAAFSKFCSGKEGVITSKELGKILRYIGQNPTEAEVQVRQIIIQEIRKSLFWDTFRR